MMRLVQAGTGDPRNVICCYYLGAYADAAVKAAAPNAAIINDTRAVKRPDGTVSTVRYTRIGDGGDGGILPLESLLVVAKRAANFREVGRLILGGYSAGGQGATTQLNAGANPDAVVIADGWHCPAGTKANAQVLTSRRAYVDAAKRGERVLIASHTQIVPPTYTSTRQTLELLTGWSLPQRPPSGIAEKTVERGLQVWSYIGNDAKAHNHQAQVVFAELLGAAMAALGLDIGSDVQTDPVSRQWMDRSLPLGERAVLLSLAEMQSGVVEEPPGSNTSTRIREFLAPAHRDGHMLNLKSAEWCAALASWAAYTCLGGYTDQGTESRRDDEAMPHAYRVSGIEIEQDARRNGMLWPARSAYQPRRGDLAIFKRGNQEWQRHVARVVDPPEPGADGYTTVGGNEGHTIRMTPRRRSDADLLYWVEYPRPLIVAPADIA